MIPAISQDDCKSLFYMLGLIKKAFILLSHELPSKRETSQQSQLNVGPNSAMLAKQHWA